jgi:DNA end-binding protein Ku
MKGNISFGLVMIPVSLYSAEAKAAQLDLDMIDARTGERIRYKRVNERTGQEVPWKSIAKGYLHDDRYITLTDADFKKAAKDVTRGIEILRFVPAEQISPLYFTRPYYIMPGKGGEKAYALLRDVLRRSERVGVCKAVLHAREHLGALTVHDDLLVLLLLRFAEELRSPKDLDLAPPAKGKVAPRELEMAEQLVKGMSGEWEPEKFHDEYRDALRKFIEAKAATGTKGRKARDAEEEDEEAPASYNIMDLLRESVKKQKTNAKPSTRTAKTPRRRKAG